MGRGMSKMLVGTWALIFREVRSQHHYWRPWSNVGSQKLLWLLDLYLWIFMVLGTEPRALCTQGKHYHWAVSLSSQSPALPHPSQNKPLSDHYFTWSRTHLSLCNTSTFRHPEPRLTGNFLVVLRSTSSCKERYLWQNWKAHKTPIPGFTKSTDSGLKGLTNPQELLQG